MARRKGLTAEDEALWSIVKKSATPLHPEIRAGLILPEAAPPAPGIRPDPPHPEPMPHFRVGSRPLRKPMPVVDLSPHPGHRLREDPLRMDHKTHRRMNQGKLSPEARIDLHGMTLNVAHPQLTRFILNAHADGRRLVLVITGKGREGGPDAPLPVRPGALRHNVPLWLHMAPLNQLVLQVRPAHRRHGGEGAYYVYLRR